MVADNDQEKKGGFYFPPNLAVLLSFPVFTIAITYVGCDLFLTVAKSNAELFGLGLFLASVGTILLLIARIPLYRQRRFFTLGPGSPTGTYRKPCFAAYFFIVPGIVLLLLLWRALK